MDSTPETPAPDALPGQSSLPSNDLGAGHAETGEGLAPSPPPCPWVVRRGKLCGKPATIQDWCRTHAADEADRRFRELIKRRDPRCRNCLEPTADCAHIFTRGRWQTRWDPDNAVGLCRPCHTYFGEHPKEWEAWCIDEVFANDPLPYEMLDYLSTSTERGAPKVDVSFVLDRLEELAHG